jgi:hypothetical protein
MAAIKALIAQLDRQEDENMILRVFTLENADPQDVVAQLQVLFPDPTTTQGRGGGNRGGRGGTFTTQSGRLVKQAKVLSVADLRTSSVIVSASEIMMVEVENFIRRIDSDTAGKPEVHVIDMSDVDPLIAQQILQSLVPSRSGVRTTTGFQQGAGAFGTRNTQQRSTATGFGGGAGIGGRGTTGGARGGGTGFGF